MVSPHDRHSLDWNGLVCNFCYDHPLATHTSVLDIGINNITFLSMLHCSSIPVSGRTAALFNFSGMELDLCCVHRNNSAFRVTTTPIFLHYKYSFLFY
jgi:hypothetical protein